MARLGLILDKRCLGVGSLHARRLHAAAFELPRLPASAAPERSNSKLPMVGTVLLLELGVLVLARLPDGEQRRAHGDGRVAADDQADGHGEREVLQRLAAEEQHEQNRDERGDRRVDRADEHLVERVVGHREERALHVQVLRVVVDAVEHDHGVVERVADDREQRGHGVRRELAPDERVNAHHDDEVVQQHDDRRDAHLELEADGDVDDDEHERNQERDERLVDDAGTPVGADGGYFEVLGRQPNWSATWLAMAAASCASVVRHAHEEALFAVRRMRRLNGGLGLAGIGERSAHVVDGRIARIVERDGRAADELDAERHALQADDGKRRHHEHGRDDEEHLAMADEVDVVLDEAALQVVHRLGDLQALGACALLHDAVGLGWSSASPISASPADTPSTAPSAANFSAATWPSLTFQKPGCFAMARGASKRTSGALNSSIMTMSHKMPSASVRPKPLTEADARKNSDSAETSDTRSASIDVWMAWRTPVMDAARIERPMRISSRKRSTVRTDESAAMPMVNTMPAMPESDRLNRPKRRKAGQDAQVQDGEHDDRARGDGAQALVEEQQVDHDEQDAEQRGDDAGEQRVLAERRADDLALRVLEADGQRAALEHGLQRLRLGERVVARDLHLAVGNLGLDGGGGLHLVVQDDDDLAMVGHEVARCLSERLGALGIELDVDRVVDGGLGCTVNRHAFDVLARDDGRVRAVLDHQVLGLARGERIAEIVGHRALVAVVARFDLADDLLVGERVEARELELARLADGVERGLRVGQAGNLHEDLVVALHLHDGLGCAERVDAALDDGTAGFHVLVGDGIAVGRGGRQHDRQAALDVEALVDLLLRGHEQDDRADDQQRRDDEQWRRLPDKASELRSPNTQKGSPTPYVLATQN